MSLPPAMSTLFVFWLASNAYVLTLGLVAVVSKIDPLSDTRFSLLKFYVLMGWAPLAFVAVEHALAEHFDRNRLVELHVARFDHDAHAASAERALDEVLFGDQVAGADGVARVRHLQSRADRPRAAD